MTKNYKFHNESQHTFLKNIHFYVGILFRIFLSNYITMVYDCVMMLVLHFILTSYTDSQKITYKQKQHIVRIDLYSLIN